MTDDDGSRLVPRPRRSGDPVLRGGLYCCAWAPVFAAVVVALYRFPIPFHETYASGPSFMLGAAVAAIFYQFIGGGTVLFIAGAVAGRIAGHVAGDDARRALRLTRWLSAVPALAAVLLMSVLDKIIGPW